MSHRIRGPFLLAAALALASAAPGQAQPVTAQHQPSTFTGPANLIEGVPERWVSSSLSTIFSTLNANVGRELRFEPIGVPLEVSSAVLGSSVKLEITDVVLRTQVPQPTADSATCGRRAFLPETRSS